MLTTISAKQGVPGMEYLTKNGCSVKFLQISGNGRALLLNHNTGNKLDVSADYLLRELPKTAKKIEKTEQQIVNKEETTINGMKVRVTGKASNGKLRVEVMEGKDKGKIKFINPNKT